MLGRYDCVVISRGCLMNKTRDLRKKVEQKDKRGDWNDEREYFVGQVSGQEVR